MDRFEKWYKDSKPLMRELWRMAQPDEDGSGWTHKRGDGYHVAEVRPRDLVLVKRPHRGVDLEEPNWVNASFAWWRDYPRNQVVYPTSMLVYDGKLLNNVQPNGFWTGEHAGRGVPTPTFIIYKDGRVALRTVNDLRSEASAIHLAVTVVQTNPNISQQGYVPYVSWSSIAYRANRVGIFYRGRDDRALLIFSPDCNIERLHQIARDEGADLGGSLDSGGSANYRLAGVPINATHRLMAAGITWFGPLLNEISGIDLCDI